MTDNVRSIGEKWADTTRINPEMLLLEALEGVRKYPQYNRAVVILVQDDADVFSVAMLRGNMSKSELLAAAEIVKAECLVSMNYLVSPEQIWGPPTAPA